MKTCPSIIQSLVRLPLSTTLALVLVQILAPVAPAAQAHDQNHPGRTSREPSDTSGKVSPANSPAANKLPPLPVGVVDLRFGDFFVRPVGTRGLELTEKLRGLDGRRVRILGYMVQQEEPPPGRLLLAPMPAQIHEHDNGLAEDLPAAMVFVSVPTSPDAAVPFVPGLMLLSGTLSVGGRSEPDGRISLVRLALDPPDKIGRAPSARKTSSAPPGKGAERLAVRVSSK